MINMSAILKINRRKFVQYGSVAIASGVVTACTHRSNKAISPSPAVASSSATTDQLHKVTFGTNWYAQAEQGGFYQAIATGIYQQHGLDVTIKMGRPQVNGTQLLMAGVIDFLMGYGADAIKAVEIGIPKITVAAIFQKDPIALLAHPNTGIKTIADLQGKLIYVSAAADTTYWPFLEAKYGFNDNQKRPYNFNSAPLLTDKNCVQQAYVTSEPLIIRKKGGFEPIVFLLANYGYTPYSATIEAKRELVDKNPDVVQRFVDASIKGWYSYLKNPTPANQLIKQANPEMTDEQLAYGLQKLKQYNIILSGDAEKMGIGAMTETRWQSFFESMARGGVYKTDTQVQNAFTLKFVNKGVNDPS